MESKRKLICTDANIWLKENKNIKVMITSLPDPQEIGIGRIEYNKWLISTCNNIIESLDEESVVFFYQTDRKMDGVIIDKKSIITNVFHNNGFDTIMSKIVIKQKVGTPNFTRMTFTNLFGFSKKYKSGSVTFDTMYQGKMKYKNAMSETAINVLLDYIKKKLPDETIVDPFCGRGSVLDVFNENGFNVIGVDIDQEQINHCKQNIFKWI